MGLFKALKAGWGLAMQRVNCRKTSEQKEAWSWSEIW